MSTFMIRTIAQRSKRAGAWCSAAALVTAAAVALTPAPDGAMAASLVVNTTTDAADATINGVCATSAGVCSLRAAIQEANASPGGDSITFAIPGTGVRTIVLGSGLPALSDTSGGTTVNGYTQPGASANTDPLLSNAVIMVALEGTGPLSFNAISITSGGNVIRGLSIYKARAKIHISGTNATGNVVAGNFLGSDPSTTFAEPNAADASSGVIVRGGARGNHIGLPDVASRNVIGGNAHQGVATYDNGTDGNFIQNNIVGLRPNGTARLENVLHGIDINYGTTGTLIGGTGPLEGNLVSGNRREGIEISHGADTRLNRIIGNRIGTNPEGTAVTSFSANHDWGIHIEDNVADNEVRANIIGGNFTGGIIVKGASKRNVVTGNFVGVTPSGANIGNSGPGIMIDTGAQFSTVSDNSIAYNGQGGIAVIDAGSDRNKITANRIFANTGLGIDLAPTGAVNVNDVGDGDVGPNQQLNQPVFSSATPARVAGTACATCSIEVFESDGGTPPSGAVYLSSATSQANGSFELAASGIANKTIVATATDQYGNTSEFSAAIFVPPPDGSSQPPVADFSASCAHRNCAFNGSGSFDPDGSVEFWQWTFGDGSSGSGNSTTHVYAQGGSYSVTLQVTDTAGRTASVTKTVVATDPPPIGVLARDTFSRTLGSGWGTADAGGSYTLIGGTASFSVDGAVGKVVLPTAGASRLALLPATATVGVDVTVDVATDKAATGFGQMPGIVVRRIGADEYRVRLRFDPNGRVYLAIVRTIGGTETMIAPEVLVNGVGAVPGSMLRLRTDIAGTNPTQIRAKVWIPGQPEPGWLTSAVDSSAPLQAAGAIGLRSSLSGSSTNAPSTYLWDNLVALTNSAPTAVPSVVCDALNCTVDGSASSDPDGTVVGWQWNYGDGTSGSGPVAAHGYAAAGRYTVALTVTDDDGAQHTATQEIDVQAPAPELSLVSDDFQRTTSPGWGSADKGGPYSMVNPTSMSVNGAKGVAVVSSSANPVARLATLAATDVEASVEVSTNKLTSGFAQYTYLTVRRVGNDEYRVRLRFGPSGGTFIAITKLVGSVETEIAPEVAVTGVTHTLDRAVKLKIRTLGTQPTVLQARVWAATDPEPGSWNVFAEDFEAGLQTNGGIALRFAVSSTAANLPVTFTVDSLRVNVRDYPPVAEFTSSCVQFTCDFQSTSSDDTGIVSSTWDYGDGTSGSGTSASHVYTAPGTYSVSLSVTDGVGNTSTRSHPVTVPYSPPVNQPPTAQMSVTCSSLTCDYTAAASMDSDGQIVGYAWDFGDGATANTVTATHAYAASGTYSVRVTVTDDDGATNWAVQSVTVTAPPALLPIANDNFQRTVTSGWGSATAGGAYSYVGTGVFSVDGSKGLIKLNAASNTGAASLTSVVEASVQVGATFSTDKPANGWGQQMFLVTRRNSSAGHEYRLRVRLDSAGRAWAQLSRVISFKETPIGTEVAVPGYVAGSGVPLRAVLRTTGSGTTQLEAKVWVASSAEPAPWLVSLADTSVALQSAGAAGIRASLSSTSTEAPVTFVIDDITVQRVVPA